MFSTMLTMISTRNKVSTLTLNRPGFLQIGMARGEDSAYLVKFLVIDKNLKQNCQEVAQNADISMHFLALVPSKQGLHKNAIKYVADVIFQFCFHLLQANRLQFIVWHQIFPSVNIFYL